MGREQVGGFASGGVCVSRFGIQVAALDGMRYQASTCTASPAGDAEAKAIIAAALRGDLTEEQAERLTRLGPEATKLALLATAKRIAEQDARIAQLQSKLKAADQISPSTPSGQRPLYAKPPARKRKGKPGAKPGHKGTRWPPILI